MDFVRKVEEDPLTHICANGEMIDKCWGADDEMLKRISEAFIAAWTPRVFDKGSRFLSSISFIFMQSQRLALATQDLRAIVDMYMNATCEADSRRGPHLTHFHNAVMLTNSWVRKVRADNSLEISDRIAGGMEILRLMRLRRGESSRCERINDSSYARWMDTLKFVSLSFLESNQESARRGIAAISTWADLESRSSLLNPKCRTMARKLHECVTRGNVVVESIGRSLIEDTMMQLVFGPLSFLDARRSDPETPASPDTRESKKSKHEKENDERVPEERKLVPKTTDPAKQCVVCLDNEATSAYIPCGHRRTCVPCARNTWLEKCPVCRKDVSCVTYIFQE